MAKVLHFSGDSSRIERWLALYAPWLWPLPLCGVSFIMFQQLQDALADLSATRGLRGNTVTRRRMLREAGNCDVAALAGCST